MTDATPMTDTERELLQAAREIGGVFEMASWASAELAARVTTAGKPVDDLTVGELRQLIRAYREYVNRSNEA